MGNSRGGDARARGILQHDVRWMRDPKFPATFQDSKRAGEDGEGGGEELRLKRMLDLLIKMEKGIDAPEALGYSQR